jgi:hypothetical protein
MDDKIKNFVDEKNTTKIVNALCDMDFLEFNQIVEDSGIPITRLLGYIDGSEKITTLDKEKLIPHLSRLSEMPEDKIHSDENVVETYSSLKNFLERKPDKF